MTNPEVSCIGKTTIRLMKHLDSRVFCMLIKLFCRTIS